MPAVPDGNLSFMEIPRVNDATMRQKRAERIPPCHPAGFSLEVLAEVSPEKEAVVCDARTDLVPHGQTAAGC